MRGRPALQPGEHGQPWTIRLPNGSTRAVVRVRDRDGRVREVTATHHTKGGALRALDRKLAARQPTASVGVTPFTTIEQLAEQWLEHRRTHGHARRRVPLRAQTLAAYSDIQRLVIVPAMGGMRVGELTVGLLEGILADLDTTGISTVGARSVLSQMFTLAERHGAISTNPMRLVAKPAREEREVEALDVPTARALRALVSPQVQRRPGVRGPKRDLADFVDLALGTGARISEILAVRRIDYTPGDTPTLHLCGTLVEPRGSHVRKLYRQDSTKSRSNRTLILPPQTALDHRTQTKGHQH